MNNKRYKKVMPFIWDCVIALTIFFFIILFVIWTKFQFPLVNIFVAISSIYDVDKIIKLYNIIRDVKCNNTVTEYMYISFISEKKFESVSSKKYMHLQGNKIKNNRYTGNMVWLKSSKNIDIKEKSRAEITYYKNSKIITSINV